MLTSDEMQSNITIAQGWSGHLVYSTLAWKVDILGAYGGHQAPTLLLQGYNSLNVST